MRRVMLTLDPSQARASKGYKLASRMDWRRGARFLAGVYPAPLPPLELWGEGSTNEKERLSGALLAGRK